MFLNGEVKQRVLVLSVAADWRLMLNSSAILSF